MAEKFIINMDTPANPNIPPVSAPQTPLGHEVNPTVGPVSAPTPNTPPPPPPSAPASVSEPNLADIPTDNNSKKTIIIIVAVVLLIILALVFVFYFSKSKLSLKKSPATKTGLEVSSKYSLDTDGDSIPDLIEKDLGFDPNVSELTRCEPASYGSQDASQTQATKNNILIIIDSSGSMNLKIGDKTKMELAKEAIKSFLSSAASNINVGIMVYGNKGSNSASDKALSCLSAETIAPIGSVTASTIDSYLSGINPVGWTPIGLAIRNGKSAFVGKEGQKNQMIIVTDGAETSDSNPAGAASEVKTSPYQIRVDVIGFAVNTTEQSSLQVISTSGGGLFSVATNVDQLLSQMRASRENFEKFQSGAKHISDVYQKSVSCLQDTQKKAFDYLSTASTGKSGAEYTELSNLKSNISSQYFKKINAVQDELNAAIKSSQQQLIK